MPQNPTKKEHRGRPTGNAKRRAKTRWKNAANEYVKLAKEGRKNIKGEAMRRAGYSYKYSQHPERLFSNEEFQKLVGEIVDEDEILSNWNEIAKSPEDKRAAIMAGKEIFKLKDRYPAGKLKMAKYQETVNRYIDEDDSSKKNSQKNSAEDSN